MCSDSFDYVAEQHNLECTAVKRYYRQWVRYLPESQPESSSDMHISMNPAGRPTVLTTAEEKLISDTLKYFIDKNTPLSQEGLKDFVQHIVCLLPPERQEKIPFKDGLPSKKRIACFLHRNDELKLKTMGAIEDKRVGAVTMANIGEHIALLKSAMKRYCIKEGSRVFNIDESGTSIRDIYGKSLRKGIGCKNKELFSNVVRTRGNLERAIVMPVISATGRALRPVVVFPGKQPHFRPIKGTVQIVIDFLPIGTYFFQREIAVVDSDILQLAKLFSGETEELRRSERKILLLLDGHCCHIKFPGLQLFKQRHIIVIGMAEHSSHVLQPLDVSVFGSYDSKFQREMHARSSEKKVLDAFDITDALNVSYTAALTPANIISGFRKTGKWDPTLSCTNQEALKRLPFADFSNNKSFRKLPTLEEVVDSFSRRSRSLLFDAYIEEQETIKIDTTSDAHLTSEKVIHALELRRERQLKKNTISDLLEDLPKRYKFYIVILNDGNT